MTARATHPVGADAGRAWLAPRWHLFGLAAVLLASSFFVGHGGYVFIDEAALLAQVEIVNEGSWTVERPLAGSDPAGRYAPMSRSTLSGDRFAPFPNHPLHVQLASWADALGGRFGLRLLSIVGVVGAALAAGLLAASISRRHAVVAVWITGVFSPLLFDANLVVAHGLAAGVAGALFVVVFRLLQRRDTSVRAELVAGLAVAGLVACGALLRSEFVLLALAIAIMAGWWTIRARTPQWGSVAGACLVGAGTAYLLEPLWVEHLVGSSSGPKIIASSSRGGVEGASVAAGRVLLGTGQGGSVALVLAVTFAVLASVLLRSRPRDAGPAVAVALLALMAAVVHATDSVPIPGIVWAFPLLSVGLVAVRRSAIPQTVACPVQTAVVFASLVLATQYAVGGGSEWGWRYVAIAIPAVGAFLAIPLLELIDMSTSSAARVAVAAVIATSLVIPVSGVFAQRRLAERTVELLERTDAARRGIEADVIVSSNSIFGRYVWSQSIRGHVVTTNRGESALAEIFDVLEDQGADRLLFVWAGDEPSLPESSYEKRGPTLVLLQDAYYATVLQG